MQQEIISETGLSRAQSKIRINSIERAIEVLLSHQDWSLAQRVLSEELKRNPGKSELWFHLASCLIGLGQRQPAIGTLKSLIKTEELERGYRLLGDIYVQEGQSEMALTCYLDALLRPPHTEFNLYQIYKNIGNIYLRQENPDMAEDFYNKAHVVHPNSDTLAVNYGTLAIQKGDLMSAMERYRRAIYINPKNAQAWTGLGIVYSELGELDLSWANLRRALDLDCRQICAIQMLCNLSLKINRENEALNLLQSSLEAEDYSFSLEEKSWDLSLLYIEFCVQCGQVQMAKIETEKMANFFPKDARFVEWHEKIRQLESSGSHVVN